MGLWHQVRQLANNFNITINPATEETLQELTACNSLLHGQTNVATAGTAVKLIATDDATKSITIKALVANTNSIYVGDSGVDSTNGYILDAGDTMSMDLDNESDNVYIDADVNGEGVSWFAIV